MAQDKLELTSDEQKIIEDSVKSIRKVLRSKNRDIKSLIGMSDAQATETPRSHTSSHDHRQATVL